MGEGEGKGGGERRRLCLEGERAILRKWCMTHKSSWQSGSISNR